MNQQGRTETNTPTAMPLSRLIAQKQRVPRHSFDHASQDQSQTR